MPVADNDTRESAWRPRSRVGLQVFGEELPRTSIRRIAIATLNFWDGEFSERRTYEANI